MKKTLLATAIAGALGVTAAAQAATVYDQDGTQVDVYGRINLGVTTGGIQSEEPDAAKTDGSEFVDVFSRFGFRARHQVAPDLQAFANMEFRPNLARQNSSSMAIRNSFLGIRGDQWGMVRIGNFDGVLYQAVTSKFDIQEYEGFTTTSGGNVSARGDSIQYSTPNLSGFQAHVQAKHISGNDIDGNAIVGEQDNSSTVSWQAAVNYEWEGLYLGLGYNQSKAEREDRGYRYRGAAGTRGNPAGEDIWAAAAIYQFTPAFRAGVKYEDVTDTFSTEELNDRVAAGFITADQAAGAIDNMWTLMGVFDYGMGEIYADYNRIRSVHEGTDSRNAWTLGANYRFSRPMYVWAEIVDYDFDSDDSISDLNDDLRFTVGLRYDF
ncbi:porin [Halomonas daqingensis]|uniref:porin n=1 Tax=Billgrantia desiderata TaxID=52021 RepID=UPI001F335B9E|nr:porin [Halomonas desiderata]MCE8030639.1 porin [Halomonas desiderata]